MEPEKIIQCPICLDTMTKPIIQCKIGHSMCGDCVNSNSIVKCPQCRKPLSTTRNYQLEQIIENMDKCLRVSCFYTPKGCKFQMSPKEKDDHESECRYRDFNCEGGKFAKWRCNFSGSLEEVYKHFQTVHKLWAEYKTESRKRLDLTKDSFDVQMISFFNGAHYFWYKHKVDTQKQMVYWVIQFIGTKKQALNYYYEFEIHQGPVKKFKVTEICENDVTETDELFDKEKCVCISFKSVRNFLENNALQFKFRIMKKSHT